ncbi:MAG TPA: caspase family protein [Cyclobacteriaceae bacterium]|nr:caspase family protein [Cyclobacteriaceae bacterium]HMV09287.1 caspase family protein [Cyclobacteriaceae bacterium]HMX01913.1 caspase family protein [Cyclobacteriaceae bacterium]HMX50836.1 caspase family protein [Cyclobacteriaceae bacterium]HMY94736.1 caspase family protein [Cyclobacteriaceae bacterium]
MVTRRAILIGAPGSGENHLYGAASDLRMMREFLESPKGGSWLPQEISVLSNPNWSELALRIVWCHEDYVMIYFFGHGFTDAETGNRMIVLRDHPMQDLELLTKSRKQLVIVDACRNFVRGGLDGIPDFSQHESHFEVYSTRELFDQMIVNSPEGHMIIHATKPGQYSVDTVNGGMFTHTLLQECNQLQPVNQQIDCYAIDSLVKFLPHKLRELDSDQVPDVAYRTGNLSVPFVFAIRGLTGINKPVQQESIKPAGMLTFTVAALAMIALIAFFSND